MFQSPDFLDARDEEPEIPEVKAIAQKMQTEWPRQTDCPNGAIDRIVAIALSEAGDDSPNQQKAVEIRKRLGIYPKSPCEIYVHPVRFSAWLGRKTSSLNAALKKSGFERIPLDDKNAKVIAEQGFGCERLSDAQHWTLRMRPPPRPSKINRRSRPLRINGRPPLSAMNRRSRPLRVLNQSPPSSEWDFWGDVDFD
jgi:hypothetical protein